MAEVDLQSLRSGRDPDEERRQEEREAAAKSMKPVAKATKKKSRVLDDLVDTIFDTSIDDVVETVKTERLIPDLKALACNTLVDGIEMLFGGGGARRRRSTLEERRGFKDYANNKRSTNGNRSGSDRDDRTGNRGDYRRFDSRDYEMESRGEAEKVLWDLKKKCEGDGKATVAEFLIMTDNPQDWSDWDIGWEELDESNTRIRAAGRKWVILLPQPIKLK